MWPFTSSPNSSANAPKPSACPVDHTVRDRDGSGSHPAASVVRERTTDPAHLPQDRLISSIPRYRPADGTPTSSTPAPADASTCPVASASASDSSNTSNWVYPSASQFFNALTRKNRDPDPKDMYTVVPIHNAVNERCWQQILEWEARYGREAFSQWPGSGKAGPMLSSFVGRPKDRSPRAWLKVLSGYQAPFDRHDWQVYRPNEVQMRYVIDFYPGRGASSEHPIQGGQGGQSGSPNLAFYLDVRPALDNYEGVRMRALRMWDDLKEGWGSSQAKQA